MNPIAMSKKPILSVKECENCNSSHKTKKDKKCQS